MAELRRLRAAALAAAVDCTELDLIARTAVSGLDCYGEVVRDLGFDPLEGKR
jgi:hypothetical protein